MIVKLRPVADGDYTTMQNGIDDGTVWTGPFVGDALALIEQGLCEPNPETWQAQQNAMFDRVQARQLFEDDEQVQYLQRRKSRR